MREHERRDADEAQCRWRPGTENNGRARRTAMDESDINVLSVSEKSKMRMLKVLTLGVAVRPDPDERPPPEVCNQNT